MQQLKATCKQEKFIEDVDTILIQESLVVGVDTVDTVEEASVDTVEEAIDLNPFIE